MLAWVRTYGGSCGNCGKPFVRGEAMLEVTVAGVRSRKKRCTTCAEGDPPPDLPLLVVREPLTAPPRTKTSGMTRVSALLPVDWKSRSAGEREPGEEG